MMNSRHAHHILIMLAVVFLFSWENDLAVNAFSSPITAINIRPTRLSMSTTHEDPQPTAIATTLSSKTDQFFESLDDWYTRSIQIKCPFFRRRAADTIDAVAMIGRFLLIRHKSLGITSYMPPGCRAMSTNSKMSCEKMTGLDAYEIKDLIEKDWKQSTDKGYYITGRLTTAIYRDDVLFSGPDPDMPVRGLRKYLGAASHLFDTKKSSAKLLLLNVIDSKTIKATWQLEGVLMLPWRPKVPSWRGSTTYHLDQDGLIHHHEEQWEKTVLEAFVTTVWPNVARRIWKNQLNEIPSEAKEMQ